MIITQMLIKRAERLHFDRIWRSMLGCEDAAQLETVISQIRELKHCLVLLSFNSYYIV